MYQNLRLSFQCTLGNLFRFAPKKLCNIISEYSVDLHLALLLGNTLRQSLVPKFLVLTASFQAEVLG